MGLLVADEQPCRWPCCTALPSGYAAVPSCTVTIRQSEGPLPCRCRPSVATLELTKALLPGTRTCLWTFSCCRDDLLPFHLAEVDDREQSTSYPAATEPRRWWDAGMQWWHNTWSPAPETTVPVQSGYLTLIPLSDDRLKPRRTKLTVAVLVGRDRASPYLAHALCSVAVGYARVDMLPCCAAFNGNAAGWHSIRVGPSRSDHRRDPHLQRSDELEQHQGYAEGGRSSLCLSGVTQVSLRCRQTVYVLTQALIS